MILGRFPYFAEGDVRICRFICGLALAAKKKQDAKPTSPQAPKFNPKGSFPVERFVLIDFERNTLTRYANGKPSERYEITGRQELNRSFTALTVERLRQGKYPSRGRA